MSATSESTTVAEKPRKPAPRQPRAAQRAAPARPILSKADALSVLRTALTDCQRAGIVLALAPNPAGSLLLLREIDLVEGVFVLRDGNAPK
jgi:hypothetical protein